MGALGSEVVSPRLSYTIDVYILIMQSEQTRQALGSIGQALSRKFCSFLVPF